VTKGSSFGHRLRSTSWTGPCPARRPEAISALRNTIQESKDISTTSYEKGGALFATIGKATCAKSPRAAPGSKSNYVAHPHEWRRPRGTGPTANVGRKVTVPDDMGHGPADPCTVSASSSLTDYPSSRLRKQRESRVGDCGHRQGQVNLRSVSRKKRNRS